MKIVFKKLMFILLFLLALTSTQCSKNPSENIKPSSSLTATSNSLYGLPISVTASDTVYQVSRPITITGVSGIVISLQAITGYSADCITLNNCSNITITNCIFHNSTGNGITLYRCKNITITNCFIYSVASGIYALESSAVNINNNQFLNMQGPFPGGQFVQFDNVSGAGNRVNSNRGENIQGSSNPEDAISMYESNGTAADPIQIGGNWIRGGGPSQTGSGIMLGDDGGSYQIVQNNVLVDPGDAGIGIASGHNIQIINNKIYGKQQAFTNVGLYVWNEYRSGCSMNTASGNQVRWTNSSGQDNGSWNGKNCGKITGWSSNTWQAIIDSTILPVKVITKEFPQ
jgi:parallel beta-helix repeat protein